MSVVPRGIRNNNPGNIRRDGTPWQGLDLVQDDPDFCVFIAPEWGIRAIARILKKYKLDGINTIAGAINRWAPPNENNTSAYITAVAMACGVGQSECVDFDLILPAMSKAIIQHENGMQPYGDDIISLGISLA